MKKQILNLGKALSKAEQKQINGGYAPECISDEDCNQGMNNQDSYCDLSKALCVDPNSDPEGDNFGCDTNPITNPWGLGC
jgi:hypothetical protein